MFFERIRCGLLIATSAIAFCTPVVAECIDPPFTHVWLSPFSMNPSFADTPLVNGVGSTALYIWARLPVGESITAISLNVASSNAVEFESASLDNPGLGSRDGLPATRFELTPEPTISSQLIEIQGFTIGQRESAGLGLSSTTRSIDPLYDAGVDAWRIGSFTLAAAETDLFLQVGMNGIQGVDSRGDVTPEFDVVFGGESDVPLCAVEDRGIASSVPDAKITGGAVSVMANSQHVGSFVQTSGAELRLGIGATGSHEPWLVSEELRASGKLLIENNGYVPPEVRGTVDRIALANAGAVTGEFESIAIGEFVLSTEPVHDQQGLFRSIDYTADALVLSNYRAIVGDLDGDGVVGFSDFLRLSLHFGMAGDWTEGDLTGVGRVEFPDFLALSQAFGTSISAALPSSSSVPEPSSWTIFLFTAPWLRRLLGKDA